MTTIFEAVRKGWLGDVFMVRANMSNNLAPARRPEWAEFKGGALFELGSHLVDAIVRLLGRPKAVTPFLRRHGKASDDFKDNNVAVFEYDGALAVLTNTALQETKLAQRFFEVLGSNGTAKLGPIEPPVLEIELVNAAGPYRKGLQAISLPEYQRYEADFVELAAAVRGERSLSVTLERNWRCRKLCSKPARCCEDHAAKIHRDEGRKEITEHTAGVAEDCDQPRVVQMPHGANKPGRNDPCPCGRGKKFKKCCISQMTFKRAQIE